MEKIQAVVAEIVKAIDGAGTEKEKYTHAFLKVLDGFSEIMAITCQISPVQQSEEKQEDILEQLRVTESNERQAARYPITGWLTRGME